MGIQYPYAESNTGEVVAVGDVDPAPPRPRFVCLSCRRPMIARFPRTKRHHFAHLTAGACSVEGYLHQLAKRTFANAFNACVAAGEPYWFVRRVKRTCTHYEAEFGFSCAQSVELKIDLTKFFKRAQVETEYDRLRADVLLSSNDRKDRLFVECVVTHFCEPEKLAKGHRILEVVIRDEADALRLGKGRIAADVFDVREHNFREHERPGDLCGGKCDHAMQVFRVFKTGRAKLFEETPQEYRRFRRHSVMHEVVLRPDAGHGEREAFTGENEVEYAIDPRTVFKEEVRLAANNGVAVKNCYLCKYHGLDGYNAAIFCKLRKKPVESNEAAECGHYRPVGDRELAVIDQKNAEYQQRTIVQRISRSIVGLAEG